MKTTLLIIAMALLASCSKPDRYQLLETHSGIVLRIDTQTGQVWRAFNCSTYDSPAEMGWRPLGDMPAYLKP